MLNIPFNLGGWSGTQFTPTGPAVDFAVDGVPFMAAWDGDQPYVRETAPYRKEQFDTSNEPGEQSIGDGWWRRWQDSFHGGAGQVYLEARDSDASIARIRFAESKNVDVWTPGRVTRLPDTTVAVATGSPVRAIVPTSAGGTDRMLVAVGSALQAWVPGGSTSTYTWGGSGTIVALASDGTKYYAADSTGVYSGPVDGSGPGTLLWNTGSSRVTLGWVKQRLMAAVANKVYELTGTGPTLPAEKYSHPSTSWTWTAFSESPNAILAAGYAGSESAVHEFVLDTEGGAPTLTSGAVVMSPPPGEIVWSLQAYLGSFLGIGTSRGVRIGQFASNGSLVWGALTVDTPAPVLAMTARDSYLFAAGSRFNDGETSLIRIDLGRPVDEAGRFAYAADLLCPTGQTTDCTAVALTPAGRLAFAVGGVGVLYEGSGPGSGREAWLVTSRIRYSTVEPKLMRYCQLRGTFLGDNGVSVKVTGSGQDEQVVFSQTGVMDPDEFRLLATPVEWVSLRVELFGSGAEFRSYQIKALSAVKRQRVIQVPLACYDSESDRFNNKFGHRGYAWERLEALERLDASGDEVSLEQFTETGVIARRVIVEQVSYRQVISPKQTGTFGGVVTLTVRTVG